MSDGPRDAKRMGLGAEAFPGRIGGDLLGVTKSDAARIIARYKDVPVGALDENEMDLLLKLKRFSGE